MNVVIDGVKYIPFVEKAEGEWLDLEYYATDIDETLTIRQYFHKLLSKLWYDPEGFGGKRPFGNSCWYFPIIYALVESGAIKGTVTKDEDGYIEDCKYDDKEADKFVQSLIAQMCLGN